MFARVSNPRNRITVAVPIKPSTFRNFIVLCFHIFDNRINVPTPRMPPKVFPSKSIISLAPNAKIYCKIS